MWISLKLIFPLKNSPELTGLSAFRIKNTHNNDLFCYKLSIVSLEFHQGNGAGSKSVGKIY